MDIDLEKRAINILNIAKRIADYPEKYAVPPNDALLNEILDRQNLETNLEKSHFPDEIVPLEPYGIDEAMWIKRGIVSHEVGYITSNGETNSLMISTLPVKLLSDHHMVYYVKSPGPRVELLSSDDMRKHSQIAEAENNYDSPHDISGILNHIAGSAELLNGWTLLNFEERLKRYD